MISTVTVARVVRYLGLLLALAVFFEGVGVKGAAWWPQGGKSKSGAKQQADDKKDDKKDKERRKGKKMRRKKRRCR